MNHMTLEQIIREAFEAGWSIGRGYSPDRDEEMEIKKACDYHIKNSWIAREIVILNKIGDRSQ